MINEKKLLRTAVFIIMFICFACGNRSVIKYQHDVSVSGVHIKYSTEEEHYAACNPIRWTNTGAFLASAMIENKNDFPVTISIYEKHYVGDVYQRGENKNLFILNAKESKSVDLCDGDFTEACFRSSVDNGTHCASVVTLK